MVRIQSTLVRSLGKGSILFLTLVCIVFLTRTLHLEDITTEGWIEMHITSFGAAGILVYIIITGIFSSIGIPRQILSLIGGAAFGSLFGSLWASIGVTLGCTMGFFYARLIGRSFVKRRFGKRIQKIETFLMQNPFTMTIALRFFPAGNNALLNLTAGMTAIPPLPFIAGSAIGYLPQTIIFALLGSGLRIDPIWRTILSAVLFALSSLLGYILYKRYREDTTTTDIS